MSVKASKFTIRKFEGDHEYAWAVFRKADIKGLGRGVIWGSQAWPLSYGCDKKEAEYYRKVLEARECEK